MRRAIAAALAMLLLVPGATVGQGTTSASERVRDAVWCTFLNAHPFYTDVPPDIDCDYEPRAMTRDEAAAYYLLVVGRHNYVMDQWACADRKAKDGLSWKANKKWIKRVLPAQRRWGESLRVVEWPDDVRRIANRLIDRNAAESFRRREAFRHPNARRAVLSGDIARLDRANDKTVESASQLRARLGLKRPPGGGNSCKKVKRYERQLAP